LSDPEIDEFLSKVHEQEGIQLRREEFVENPGLRQLTKLMLNNLWGRYGMRQNKTKTKFVTSFTELQRLNMDPSLEICGIRIITEDVVQVAYRKVSEDFVPTSSDTNIYIAIATTAWARIRLYEDLDRLKERVVYCDTDSIVYIASPNREENLETGNFLGQMKNELDDDDYIEDFVSGGPKNYGYRTKKGKTCVKVKGFSLNSVNAPVLSFENIKRMILNAVRFAPMEDESDEIVLENLMQGFRKRPANRRDRMVQNKRLRITLLEEHEKVATSSRASAIVAENGAGISAYNAVRIFRTRDWKVVQKPEQKLYSFWFDKRIICHDYDTVPFGFCNC
jgi:hypothetical protein